MTAETRTDTTAPPTGLPAALEGLAGCTTTQGIPTLFAPRAGNEITAGLFFRVGTADETLATSGITHLVEHLALHRSGVSDTHHNGATAGTYTLFHVTGTEAEVVAHLNSVCASLRDLPLERLETEKEILRTEAAGRGRGVNHQLPLWRYGAEGYGLAAYSELGVWRLTPDEVRWWAQTRFTRDNAVLWITSDHVPEGLELTLPAGRRIPAPAAGSALPTTPAYIGGEDGQVVLDAVVRRSTAASLFTDVLGRALFQELRQEGGYSYVADADYSPRDADRATVTAFADALPQKQDAVTGAFVDVLARLRAGRIEPAELESAKSKALKSLEGPDVAAAALPSWALNLLMGHEIMSPDQHRERIAAVTVEDVRDVAREAWSTALVQVPGRDLAWAGCAAAPQYSPAAVEGTRHASLEDGRVTLVIGAEGVSLLLPGGPVTVRYDRCAAMTARPDGARVLTGLDGFRVEVEPTLFKGVTPERLAVIDAAVPQGSVVPLPPRDEVPRPQARSRARASGSRTVVSGSPAVPVAQPSTPGRSVLRWLIWSVTAFFTLIAVVLTLDELTAPVPDTDVLLGVWILELPLALASWSQWRTRPRA
ncbi:M16 family metallopeptidase [Streptomyces fragilis]|uniref:Insulinase family protein n=1 Tax=Streptomyces fragilis TaxID=67301 RepID=A0ABV2YJS3_9ACTN|nr:insulinase family protein [Streptomyces fragilis]